jgi:peptidoglycan/LPS O-acetylase OafA/YrhL
MLLGSSVLATAHEREEGIDALRGVAAIAVAWFHFTQGQPLFLADGSLFKLSGQYGYLGVSAFFVLSGFVIPYSMDRANYQLPRNVRDFATRRFFRIYPAYVASLIITVTLTFLSSLLPISKAVAPDISARMIVGHLTYLAPWMSVPWALPIYWTLAIEVQFYLLMVLAAPLLLSRKKPILTGTLFAVACLSLVPSDERLLFQFLPLFGIGFSWFLARTARLTLVDATAQALGFAFMAWWIGRLDDGVLGLIVFGLMTIPIRSPIPVISLLGTLSYSIYLLHSPIGGRVINLAARLPRSPAIQIIALVLAMVLTIAASYVLWRYVERPALRLGKRLVYRRAATHAVAGRANGR